ncbi:hypothetical protein [Seohaeicola zhoushanensis]|uniref:Uncharacterized protein n=1 Tax=Seohaeicola zhoushanensis TaxID=1569283 RepID=A0A8J3MAE2_9RHOB|nr:hypothetical protein [Seohaeicola zhoushanensis]GHF73688.1 hypothetical protein GCM10017056_50600 [Seohaeicola zhoushanensis]
MTHSWQFWALLSAGFAILAALFLGERLTAGGWAGVGLISAGALLLAIS